MPGGQSRQADVRPALRVHNPVTQGLLDRLAAAVADVQAAVAAGDVDQGDVLGVAAVVFEVGEQVRGLHYSVVGMADQSGWWGVAGYASTQAWLRHTHLLGGRGANRVSRTARWLTNQPDVAAALGGGGISEGHVQVMRAVATGSPARAAAFREVAAEWVAVAGNADAEYLGRVMRSWGDTVDAQTSNDQAQVSFERRGLHLSPVGEGWDVRGWLTAADGAELAGLVNERMATTLRDNPDLRLSVSQRRADALLDLARCGGAAGLAPAARDRAKVLVLVPAERLTDCPTCRPQLGEHLLHTVALQFTGHRQPEGCSSEGLPTDRCSIHAGQHSIHCPDSRACSRGECGSGGGSSGDGGSESVGSAGGGSGDGGSAGTSDPPPQQRGGEPPDTASAQWRTGNGVGRGHLPMVEAHRLSCDGAIQRVVLSAQSAVLDVGRTQRLVTPAIRTALEVRDGGCVIPGCDRPPGWCEAHHVTHWSAGGSTSLQNLVLACSRHHHEIHHGTWHVSIDDPGQVTTTYNNRQTTPRVSHINGRDERGEREEVVGDDSIGDS